MNISVWMFIIVIAAAFCAGVLMTWIYLMMRYGGHTVTYKKFRSLNGRDAISYAFHVSADTIVKNRWLLFRCKRSDNLDIGAADKEKSYNTPIDINAKEYKQKQKDIASAMKRKEEILKRLYQLYEKLAADDDEERIGMIASMFNAQDITDEIDRLETELEKLEETYPSIN